MGWSDETFKTRVKARAKVLGRSMRQVLADAGMSPDTLEKVPTTGRRIDTLEKIGEALDWSLPQVLGLEPLSNEVTPELMQLALDAAALGLRYVPDRDKVKAEVIARVYNVLADMQRDGLPVNEETAKTLGYHIARTWRKNS
jgi:lambda repressor-like predicted transcriptional regulator